MPAENERELAILERMRKGLERLSVERALSGPGLADIYRAVAASYGFSDAEHSPAEVEHMAISGEDEMAMQALDFFVRWLARFAGDMALVFGARGGVYIGGGIAPKLLPRLEEADFRQEFERKGRMKPYVEAIPIKVIVSDYPGLKGAAAGLRTKLANA